MLSDAGYEVAQKLLRIKTTEQEENISKSLYINPDFSLMVPVRELPSASLYRIMAWTEMVKDDIILNAQISRARALHGHADTVFKERNPPEYEISA
jgi:hypothetical protein